MSGSAFVSGAKRLAVQILSRYDISSKGAVLPKRNDEEMGLTNSLYALANTAIMIKDSILNWKMNIHNTFVFQFPQVTPFRNCCFPFSAWFIFFCSTKKLGSNEEFCIENAFANTKI